MFSIVHVLPSGITFVVYVSHPHLTLQIVPIAEEISSEELVSFEFIQLIEVSWINISIFLEKSFHHVSDISLLSLLHSNWTNQFSVNNNSIDLLIQEEYWSTWNVILHLHLHLTYEKRQLVNSSLTLYSTVIVESAIIEQVWLFVYIGQSRTFMSVLRFIGSTGWIWFIQSCLRYCTIVPT